MSEYPNREEAKLVDMSKQYLEDRFQPTLHLPVLDACQIFDPTNWPLNGTELSFRKEKLAVLVECYLHHLVVVSKDKTIGQSKVSVMKSGRS